MKNFSTLIILFAFAFASHAQTKDYSGFTETSAQVQKNWEAKFDSNLHASDIDNFIKTLSAVPHHVGSPGDLNNVNFILNKYKSWGFDARVDTFYCLFPTPKVRVLELVAPTAFK